MITGAILRIYLMIIKKEESSLKWVVFVIYFLGLIAVAFTGLMGGSMVYTYMLQI
jgi:hypothetical protein